MAKVRHNVFRRRQCGGFTMAEVVLSLIVFTMMTLMFAAVFPMAVRGAQYSSNYAQATMIAQHKMDQLRSGGYDKIFDTTKLQSLNLIDAVNADGSYDFTTSDNLINNGTIQGYFPSGSAGTITVTNYTTNGVPSGTLAYVTVKISWTAGGVSNGSYSLSSFISKDVQP